MQIQIFQIPASGNAEAQEEMNRFMRAHRVLQLERRFCETGGYWAFCLTWQEGEASTAAPVAQQRSGRKDYREVLNEEVFARFAHYRDVRKALARQMSVPPYVIFTDEELSKLAEPETLTVETILGVKGIGQARLEKYGQPFLVAVEATRQAVVQDGPKMPGEDQA